MAGDFHATKIFSLKSHKVNWPVVIKYSRPFYQHESSFDILTGVNISFTGSYSGHVTLGNVAREELLWWMENLKLCNGRKIQQREPHMIIKTDASTKGCGAYCKGVSTGGNDHKRRIIFT